MQSSSGSHVEKFPKAKKQSRLAGYGKDDNRKRNKTSRGGKDRYDEQE